MTLIGAAGAGLLLWLASQTDADSLGGYWAQLGLIAAAGLALAASQLLGGWTKWGWPRVSGSVFLLGFVPALVAGGLVLLHAQPDAGAWGTGWAGDLGADGLAEDLTAVLPGIALCLGLLFGFTFDTTGPRIRGEVIEEHEEVRKPGYVGPIPVDTTADEPLAAERPVVTRTSTIERDEEYAAARAERGTPVAPQPEPEPRRDRDTTD
jgi:hypothetical protein